MRFLSYWFLYVDFISCNLMDLLGLNCVCVLIFEVSYLHLRSGHLQVEIVHISLSILYAFYLLTYFLLVQSLLLVLPLFCWRKVGRLSLTAFCYIIVKLSPFLVIACDISYEFFINALAYVEELSVSWLLSFLEETAEFCQMAFLHQLRWSSLRVICHIDFCILHPGYSTYEL